MNFTKHVDNEAVPKDDDEENTHPENELLLRQLVHADKILLNKVDLIKEESKKTETLDHIKKCIAHVNKHAQIQETVYAKADLNFLITKNETEKVV